MIRSLPLLPLALLAACGRGPDAAERPPRLIDDPAATLALAGPIMVDPDLAEAANEHLARSAAAPGGAPLPPPFPLSGTAAPGNGVPATLGELAGDVASGRPACLRPIAFGAGWAARLPAALALPHAAAVTEAAGSDACGLRAVRFVVPGSAADLAGRYAGRARRAGYRVTGNPATMSGRRGALLFTLHTAPGGDGTEGVLVATGGG